ncbi:hypothetical protein IHE44_0000283 [Lamprotornis superbus]|uniref:Uncharacterized protein n=1 Tax=Lamprotornis superbus TaxID=245042 RepID=A0A835P085_9PASS|nr:hypothetical protein IHE44_0000283 [Lamprotornis superbus]
MLRQKEPKETMFSFFRKSQDSKKVTEREADGFVIVEVNLTVSNEMDCTGQSRRAAINLINKIAVSQSEGAANGGGSSMQVTQLMINVETQRVKLHFQRPHRCTVNLHSSHKVNTGHRSQLTVSSTEMGNQRSQTLESSPFMSDLLSDVPFALAPHVLAVQGTHSDVPDRLLTYDINDNLSRFWEASTLHSNKKKPKNEATCDILVKDEVSLMAWANKFYTLGFTTATLQLPRASEQSPRVVQVLLLGGTEKLQKYQFKK